MQISWAPKHFEVDFELGPSSVFPPPPGELVPFARRARGISPGWGNKPLRFEFHPQKVNASMTTNQACSHIGCTMMHQSCIHNIHINSIKYTCLIRSSRLSIFSIRFLSSFSSWDPNNKEPGPCPGGITTWTRSPAEFSVGISEFGSMKGYAVPNQLGQFQAAYPP